MSVPSGPDFDARARSYDALRPADAAWWERFALLVQIGDLTGRRVLDVGCGTGRLAAALADKARARVWGIDLSEVMVSVAREAVPASVGIRQGAADQLPFRDGWFDRVTMSLVVHLLDRPPAFVETRRVVSADGRIAIATFHPDHFTTYWLNPFFPSIRATDEVRFPSGPTLESELVEAGFPHVETRRLITEIILERDEALARIRGRHISTFDLLPPDEIEDGTARAERELPERIVTRLDQLIVVGCAG
ncbi:MAG: methyltransferase domain-containing protein [Thermoleophilia bacterium]